MESKGATVQRIAPALVRALIDAPCLARSAVVHPWLKLPMRPPWHHQAHPCSSPAQASLLTLSILVVERKRERESETRPHIWLSAATPNRRDLIRTLPDHALEAALLSLSRSLLLLQFVYWPNHTARLRVSGTKIDPRDLVPFCCYPLHTRYIPCIWPSIYFSELCKADRHHIAGPLLHRPPIESVKPAGPALHTPPS